jgi:hypothetical protein
MKSYKLVEWSYPTSPNAIRFGFAKTGCYTLHTANVEFVPFDGHKTVSGHGTLEEAKQAGEAFPYQWHPEMSNGWRADLPCTGKNCQPAPPKSVIPTTSQP